MKLNNIYLRLNKWVKPTKVNVGDIIKYDKDAGETRYCKIIKIENNYIDRYWGYFVDDLKDINKSGRHTNLSFSQIDWVLK